MDELREAADSQQPGADIVRLGEKLCLLFIDEKTGEIYNATDKDGWRLHQIQVSNVK